jgi:hypothetical protein
VPRSPAGELVALRAELDEANAEIARHHRDFIRIRAELDRADECDIPDVDPQALSVQRANALYRIRNIVG